MYCRFVKGLADRITAKAISYTRALELHQWHHLRATLQKSCLPFQILPFRNRHLAEKLTICQSYIILPRRAMTAYSPSLEKIHRFAQQGLPEALLPLFEGERGVLVADGRRRVRVAVSHLLREVELRPRTDTLAVIGGSVQVNDDVSLHIRPRLHKG